MSDGSGEPSFADVLNGISGPARPKGERRGLFRRRREAEEDQGAADEGAGAQVPDEQTEDVLDADDVGSSASPTTPGGFPAPGRHEMPQPEPEVDAASIVRPYAWTGGRTRPAYDLAVETLVSIGAQARDPSRLRQYEHRAVADLCRDPRSVAEIAALLKLPLGVARVLIGDMASQGTVVVHQTAGSSGDVPDMALMERVLSGLRRL